MISYKKIIRSRKLRLAILRFFSFIPDRWMIRFQYRMKLGRRLNLKNPARYTEKLQWYKLNYKNLLMPMCVDKYDVRKYVERIGLGNALTECYGVFDSAEDVDFSVLPQKFVIKDTLGSGGNSVIICKEKNELDIESTRLQMHEWLSINSHKKSGGREWPYYSGKKHRIIVEEYIDSDEEEGGLIDYKFFCFNGRAEYLYVIADRALGNDAGFGIFTYDFIRTEYMRVGERKLIREVQKPNNYDEMIRIAEKLSESFPHARVDMYNRNGKIIFGEITFFSGSGYISFEPDEFDYLMGEKFVLPERMK